MKLYLILGEPRTEAIHTDRSDASTHLDLGYGNHWAIVRGHSPQGACESYFGNARAYEDGMRLRVIEWPPEGLTTLSVKTGFNEIEED